MAGQKTSEREQYLELIHSPADLACETVAWAERILNTPGVPFGIREVDAKMNPMHPGDLVVICGRPGHGKTSLLATLARAEALRIIERGTTNEVVLYVTWEQVAEEINLILDVNRNYQAVGVMRGEVGIEAIRKQAIQRVKLPIWILGNSIARTSVKSLRMFPDVVCRAIEQAVEEKEIKPTLLLFDYVQIIPTRNVDEKVLQVSVAAEQVKEVALRVGCPGVVAAQARRETDDREWKVPTIRDAQWASAIEQVTDKFFGVWRPWLTDREKPPINVSGTSYPITEELFILELSKQRFGEAGMRWGMHFQPRDLHLCAIEGKRREPAGLVF
jgi:replicative DNA helicase